MTGDNGPRPGDRVRVAFEDVVNADGKYSGWRRVLDGNATVEVLERADDPSNDPVGTLRREGFEFGHTIWQVIEDQAGKRHWACAYSTAPGNRAASVPSSELATFPVIGAVPGTPAAEAQESRRHCDTCECIHPPCGYVMGSQGCDSVCDQKPEHRPSVRVVNEPHGPSPDTRQRIADQVTAGQIDAAVAVAQQAGMGLGTALAYVREMSEYQSYLSEHGEKREPRVFPSDGPEPPADVVMLHDSNPGPEDMPYLHRTSSGWRWSPSTELIEPDAGSPDDWRRSASQAYGRDLVEVLS